MWRSSGRGEVCGPWSILHVEGSARQWNVSLGGGVVLVATSLQEGKDWVERACREVTGDGRKEHFENLAWRLGLWAERDERMAADEEKVGGTEATVLRLKQSAKVTREIAVEVERVGLNCWTAFKPGPGPH